MFKIERIYKILKFDIPGVYMTECDMKDTYYSVINREHHQNLLRFYQ